MHHSESFLCNILSSGVNYEGAEGDCSHKVLTGPISPLNAKIRFSKKSFAQIYVQIFTSDSEPFLYHFLCTNLHYFLYSFLSNVTQARPRSAGRGNVENWSHHVGSR